MLQISQHHISVLPDTVHGGNAYEKDVGIPCHNLINYCPMDLIVVSYTVVYPFFRLQKDAYTNQAKHCKV
jgi:hypothetical protein